MAPPPKNGCDAIAVVLMVVVAVAVSFATYGAASAYFGAGTGSAIAAGAVAGAAGSATSSAVGSAMGVTSFSWRGVAAGAVTGAITAGIGSKFGSVGEALRATQYGKAAALALANAGAGYAGQKIAGVETSFSWRSIATSAVSSLASAKATPLIAGKLGVDSAFGYGFTEGVTAGMVSASLRSSFGQTLHGSDYFNVVADAFGNALGSAMSQQQVDRAVQRAQVETGMPSLFDPSYVPDWLQGGGGDGDLTSFSNRYPNAMAYLGDGGGSASHVYDGERMYERLPGEVLRRVGPVEQAPYPDDQGHGSIELDIGHQAPEWESLIYEADESGSITTLDSVIVSASDEVDEMGQPLYGRSNYDAAKKFGEIWGRSEGVGEKLAQTWRWANYTVPDKEQRRIEREARENQFWRIDQMRQSPLGSAAYLAGHLSGASQETKDALLATGSMADAMMPGSARAPLRPASVRVRPGQPMIGGGGVTGNMIGAPNLTERGTLLNLRPQDPAIAQRPVRTLVQDGSGRYWLQSPGGNRITPSGAYDFVTLPNGEIRVARPNPNIDFSTHLGLSGGGEVKYAGSIRFGNNMGPGRGSIIRWTNDSGHYKPPAQLHDNAGLPEYLFRSY